MKVNNRKVWKVVYTKPRSEKKAAERLEQEGIEVYCPMQMTMRQWSDRKKKVSTPIFPSYIFVKITESESSGVLADPGILNFVFWLGQPALIRQDEIDGVRAFLENHGDSTIEVVNYNKGELVAINSGPLKGHSGIVQDTRKDKVSLTIDSLGLVIKVALHAGMIEKSKHSI